MQCLSLDGLRTLLAEGTFISPRSEGPPKLSRITTILLVFQADSQHEEITNVYMGLVVCQVESCLYTPDQILDFVKDIEVNLQAAHDALKSEATPARGTPIAFLWTISAAPCPSPQTLPIAWCNPPVMSKASNQIISTLATVLQGHACIIVYAAPPYSPVTMIPKSVLTMSGVTSSCPVGRSTMIGCTPLF